MSRQFYVNKMRFTKCYWMLLYLYHFLFEPVYHHCRHYVFFGSLNLTIFKINVFVCTCIYISKRYLFFRNKLKLQKAMYLFFSSWNFLYNLALLPCSSRPVNSLHRELRYAVWTPVHSASKLVGPISKKINKMK